MRNSKDTDIRDVLPAVQAPTLVLHRTGDQVEEIEAGRYVASKIPGARFVELPGDDGIPWLGDSEAILSEIQAFVGEGAKPGSGPIAGSRPSCSPTSWARPRKLGAPGGHGVARAPRATRRG